MTTHAQTLYPSDAEYNRLLTDAGLPDLEFQEALLLDAIRGTQMSDTPQLHNMRSYLREKIKQLLEEVYTEGRQRSSVLCLPGSAEFDETAKSAGIAAPQDWTEEQMKEYLEEVTKIVGRPSQESYREDLLRTLYTLLMMHNKYHSTILAVECGVKLQIIGITDGKKYAEDAAERLRDYLNID